MPNQAEQVFTKAIELHQRGHLAQAENLYREVLAHAPNHVDSLNLLGVLALQTGRNALAVEFIGKAIALNDRVPDFHNNIGEAFRRLGHMEQAVDHFTVAIGLEPTFIEAEQNLGDTLKMQGKLDQAGAIYSRALEHKPDLVGAHTGLADILRRQGRFDEAVAHFRQVLSLRPGSAEAHNNLGIALREQGKLDDAIRQFDQAISLGSNFVEAHNNLGNALRERGKLDLAAMQLRQALVLKPDHAGALHNLALVYLASGAHVQALGVAIRAVESSASQANKALFVRCLKARPSAVEALDHRPLVLRAVSETWARPGELAQASASLIKANTAVKSLMERVGGSWPDHPRESRLLEDPDFDTLAADELLRRLLESAPIGDPALERLLTALRSALLESADEEPVRMTDEPAVGFFCALARQCFINDYVFIHAHWEQDKARAMRDSLDAALQARTSMPMLWPIAVACYVPLHSLSHAHLLLRLPWPEPVRELLAQQVRDAAAARQYRASMPRLTAIEDSVSLSVRRQYEESPYPSWVKIPPADEWPTIDAYLRNLFPLTQFQGLGSRDHEILIAGCGTGQQSIEIAQRFPRARVLGVDLSIASLAYAQMKTHDVGLSNVEYAQADILKLGTIGRTFDVIESTGVLHHLADPLQGWRVLLSLLRPGGFMRLGLYSKLARPDVEAGRALIARRGYGDTPDDIRRCRQEMMRFDASPALHRLSSSPDFASTSACRDLLFHAYECQLTLVQIERFLADDGLGFLGFELDAQVLEQYRARYPEDVGAKRLDLWHQFEIEYPHTFSGMYQFWIQKPR